MAAPVELSKSRPPAVSVNVPPSVIVCVPASLRVLIVWGAVVVTLAPFE